MKNVKKVLVLVLLAIVLTACKSSEKPKQEAPKKNVNAYVFTYDNKDYILGEEFNPDNYGKYKTLIEIPSCAFEGLDKTYVYDHYEVTTYPNNGKDYIYNVYLSDNQAKTAEGVKISDSIDVMFAKYGTDYETEEEVYIYKKGNSSLKFVIENDKITSIEYQFEE